MADWYLTGERRMQCLEALGELEDVRRELRRLDQGLSKWMRIDTEPRRDLLAIRDRLYRAAQKLREGLLVEKKARVKG